MQRPNKCSVCGNQCDGWICPEHEDPNGGDSDKEHDNNDDNTLFAEIDRNDD